MNGVETRRKALELGKKAKELLSFERWSLPVDDLYEVLSELDSLQVIASQGEQMFVFTDMEHLIPEDLDPEEYDMEEWRYQKACGTCSKWIEKIENKVSEELEVRCGRLQRALERRGILKTTNEIYDMLPW